MRESNFASEMKLSCNAIDCFYYKIPDSYGNERFTPKKPFDAFLFLREVGHCNVMALEYKMIKSKTSFPFSKVPEHQIGGLTQADKNGAHAYIVVNYRARGLNRVFAININDYLRTIDMYKDKRKSIPFDELEKISKEIKRKKINGKWLWDMYSFIYGE